MAPAPSSRDPGSGPGARPLPGLGDCQASSSGPGPRMLNVPSQAFPASGSQQRAASQGRSKVPLKQGRSLMDWIRLTKSGKDLTGLKGRLIEVTEEELKKHNKKDDCWICIRGLVYNVSPYMEYHPGGEDELMRAAGADGTDLFDQVHRWVNYESMLKECLVGRMAVKPSVPKETEGILQKLQRSVEQEENKWKIKVDESQKAIKQMQSSFTSSEQELERLRGENKDIENLRRERELLKMELEKAKIEQATCVTEVRQLKTQLNETLTKLKNVQRERKKVADDLHKAQQSLNFIHSKISINAAGDTAVTENSDVSPEMETPEKETVSTSLNQTVAQLQQLLWEVNQQLTKEK